MKKNFLRAALVSLFTLSVGVGGAVLTQAAAGGGPPPPCPACDKLLGCGGSTCSCSFSAACQCYKCFSTK